MKSRTTFIYALIDSNEPDIIRYVGKSNNINTRLTKHINESKKSKSHKNNWIKKIILEGRRPKVILLKEVSHIEWREWEIYFIKKHKTKYLTNVTKGGDGGIMEDKYEIISLKNWKKVVQIDVDTEKILNTFLNISDAANYMKAKSRSRISDCCNGKCKTSSGFIWRFVDENNVIIEPKIKKEFKDIRKRVAKINSLTNKVIEIYESASKAAREINLKDSTGINGVCHGKFKTIKNFSWRFVDNENNIIEPEKVLYKKTYKIGQFDLDNNLISVYKNAKEAANSVKLLSGCSIMAVCKGKNKTSKNYLWKFLDDNDNVIKL
jgi:hypothetical protein